MVPFSGTNVHSDGLLKLLQNSPPKHCVFELHDTVLLPNIPIAIGCVQSFTIVIVCGPVAASMPPPSSISSVPAIITAMICNMYVFM